MISFFFFVVGYIIIFYGVEWKVNWLCYFVKKIYVKVFVGLKDEDFWFF